ncbi:MAG: hypothetical protein ACI845_000041 [Gammaproteobacteria bacterium]|jgi:hypothetical protein
MANFIVVLFQFKYPVVLSIIAGLACGVNHYDYQLSFSRTFVLFPFFLMGHFNHEQIIKKSRKAE